MELTKREGKRGTTWYARFDLPPHPVTGNRRQKRVSAPTKKQAEKLAREELHRIETGRFIEPKTTTLSEYLTFWLETYAAPNVRPTTDQNYERLIRVHIAPSIGGIQLQKLQPAQLQSFYSEKLTSGRADGKQGGLSTGSVNAIHRLIREALQQAMKWELVARNVADATEPPRPQQNSPKVWDTDQVSQFLAYVEQSDDFFNPLWHLALTTGMRRGELLGLRWQDLDLDQQALRIRQNLVEVGGNLEFQEPKTKSGRCTVALMSITVDKLREHRRKQVEHRLSLGSEWEDQDLVFPNATGGPLFPSNVGRHLRKLMDEVGLPKIAFHGLRHTHATLLLKDGVHLKIASERLGHSSISLTADTYSHVLPDMQRQAIAQLDASTFQTEQRRA